MNNVQDQGRACYKRGDYQKAIELFDRAIGRSPSVQLLDNRAACYEKLQDYPTALKDAKKAIQLHREDAVGYLRAGRLLVKMEKQSVALEIYTHGLKCIKHVGQGYEQLRKVHKELMDLLCPPKSVDPMTVLPRELAETILEYLSFRQRMNACLVSKQWTLFIRSVPNLWQHLDLSGARRKVRTSYISLAINIARARLKAATLNNLYDFDKTLSALVKHCPIEELTMLECPLQGESLNRVLARATNLKSLKVLRGSHFNSYGLAPILTSLSDTLEAFECAMSGRQAPGCSLPTCARLKYFSVTFMDSFDHFRLIMDVPKAFPALETLIVHQDDHSLPRNPPVDLQDCQRLRHLDFQMNFGAPQLLRVPKGLTVCKLTSRFPVGLPASYLPLLEELQVHGSMAMEGLHVFLDPPADTNTLQDSVDLSEPTDLRKLSISSSDSSNSDLKRLVSSSRLKNLVSLCLMRCLDLDDSSMELVASTKFEKLRHLDLTGAALTGVGVRDLVTSLNLDTLILNECSNVSPDAVEWARSKGVQVKYRISNGFEGRKKVRY